MSTIKVRRARAGDAARLALVAAATFLETFAEIIAGDDILAHCELRNSQQVYADALDDRDSALWLAETGRGAPVGFAMLTPPDLPVVTSSADVELKRIYLLSAYHGGGAGRALLNAASEEAIARGKSRLLLGVAEDNIKALGFYRAMGFEAIGARRFQVGDALYDDVVLARPL